MRKTERITYRCTQADAEFVSDAGLGNASDGIRTVIEFARFYRELFSDWMGLDSEAKEAKRKK